MEVHLHACEAFLFCPKYSVNFSSAFGIHGPLSQYAVWAQVSLKQCRGPRGHYSLVVVLSPDPYHYFFLFDCIHLFIKHSLTIFFGLDIVDTGDNSKENMMGKMIDSSWKLYCNYKEEWMQYWDFVKEDILLVLNRGSKEIPMKRFLRCGQNNDRPLTRS